MTFLTKNGDSCKYRHPPHFPPYADLFLMCTQAPTQVALEWRREEVLAKQANWEKPSSLERLRPAMPSTKRSSWFTRYTDINTTST